jgi:hypothetical protein
MRVYGRLSRGLAGGKRGKEKDTESEKDRSTLHIYK